MPLAFACGWGGIITMVGTPPNIIAVGAMTSAGLEPFGFFEFAGSVFRFLLLVCCT